MRLDRLFAESDEELRNKQREFESSSGDNVKVMQYAVQLARHGREKEAAAFLSKHVAAGERLPKDVEQIVLKGTQRDIIDYLTAALPNVKYPKSYSSRPGGSGPRNWMINKLNNLPAANAPINNITWAVARETSAPKSQYFVSDIMVAVQLSDIRVFRLNLRGPGTPVPQDRDLFFDNDTTGWQYEPSAPESRTPENRITIQQYYSNLANAMPSPDSEEHIFILSQGNKATVARWAGRWWAVIAMLGKEEYSEINKMSRKLVLFPLNDDWLDVSGMDKKLQYWIDPAYWRGRFSSK